MKRYDLKKLLRKIQDGSKAVTDAIKLLSAMIVLFQQIKDIFS